MEKMEIKQSEVTYSKVIKHVVVKIGKAELRFEVVSQYDNDFTEFDTYINPLTDPDVILFREWSNEKQEKVREFIKDSFIDKKYV